jgi:hypothetical protein
MPAFNATHNSRVDSSIFLETLDRLVGRGVPDVGAILVTPQVRRVPYSDHPWPSLPTPFLRSCLAKLGVRSKTTRAKQLAGTRDRLMSGEFHRRLKRIGTVRSTCSPCNSRGGAGKGCARRNSARASSSSALAPDERRDTAVDHTPLPVEAEEDLSDPLLATRLCYRRIALVTLEQRHDLRFPRRHRVRIVRGDPALRGGGRDRGGPIWKRLRRGGRRCRRARLLALRGWDRGPLRRSRSRHRRVPEPRRRVLGPFPGAPRG